MLEFYDFIKENIGTVIFVGFLIVNLINAITTHFTQFTGLKKVGLVIAQFLSFVKSKDEAGALKLPGVTKKG
jgi:hypothetical protein